MDIFYWSDYACPYCYIGETNMKAALRELGLEVRLEMRAFELDPGSSRQYAGPTVARLAKKYGLSLSEAEKSLERIDRFAADSGLAFHYADARYTNTFDAHRLTKLAQSTSPDLADSLSERLFEAYFCGHEELADHAVLRRAAHGAGMEAGAVDELLGSDVFSREVRDEEAMAHRCGVTGVPFFVVDGRYSIPGALSAADMASALKRIMAAETAGDGNCTGERCGDSRDSCRGGKCGPDGGGDGR